MCLGNVPNYARPARLGGAGAELTDKAHPKLLELQERYREEGHANPAAAARGEPRRPLPPLSLFAPAALGAVFSVRVWAVPPLNPKP